LILDPFPHQSRVASFSASINSVLIDIPLFRISVPNQVTISQGYLLLGKRFSPLSNSDGDVLTSCQTKHLGAKTGSLTAVVCNGRDRNKLYIGMLQQQGQGVQFVDICTVDSVVYNF